MPLTESEARRLITSCEQAPFGKGERTIVDKTVRDTWEMDSNRIRFENPQWDIWLQSVVVPSVCQQLGVDTAPLPTAELYKLLVYETGSQ